MRLAAGPTRASLPRASPTGGLRRRQSAFPTGGFAHSRRRGSRLATSWNRRRDRSFAIVLATGARCHAESARREPILSALDRDCDAFHPITSRTARAGCRARRWLARARGRRDAGDVCAPRVDIGNAFADPSARVRGASASPSKPAQQLSAIHLHAIARLAAAVDWASWVLSRPSRSNTGSAAPSIAIGRVRNAADDIAQTAPLLDLFQATQDRLYSRLFPVLKERHACVTIPHDPHDHGPHGPPRRRSVHERGAPLSRDYSRARLHGRHRRAGRQRQDRAAAGALPGLRDTLRSASSPTTSSRTRTPSSWCRNEALPPERIRAVETGGCPHAAIREDITPNLLALEELMQTLQARSALRRERRRQPRRAVQPRAGRLHDLRHRRRRRRQDPAQGRPRHHAVAICW